MSSSASSSASISVFDVEINEDTSISILRYFLDLAAKRGAYSLPEAGRIMEVLTYYEKKEASSTSTAENGN